MPQRDFERLLFEAVNEGLSSLGESSRRAIYFHLEKSFNIKKQEIPQKIDVFADAIAEIFELGAAVLEILIMRRLYEKIGGIFELQDPTDFTLVEYVTAARRQFLKKNRTENVTELIV